MTPFFIWYSNSCEYTTTLKFCVVTQPTIPIKKIMLICKTTKFKSQHVHFIKFYYEFHSKYSQKCTFLCVEQLETTIKMLMMTSQWHRSHDHGCHGNHSNCLDTTLLCSTDCHYGHYCYEIQLKVTEDVQKHLMIVPYWHYCNIGHRQISPQQLHKNHSYQCTIQVQALAIDIQVQYLPVMFVH